MMKKTSSLIAIAAAAVLVAPICFVDSSATIVNNTNYSCPGFPINISKCTKSLTGVLIQPNDSKM